MLQAAKCKTTSNTFQRPATFGMALGTKHAGDNLLLAQQKIRNIVFAQPSCAKNNHTFDCNRAIIDENPHSPGYGAEVISSQVGQRNDVWNEKRHPAALREHSPARSGFGPKPLAFQPAPEPFSRWLPQRARREKKTLILNFFGGPTYGCEL